MKRVSLLLIAALLGACSTTTPPTPPPAAEVKAPPPPPPAPPAPPPAKPAPVAQAESPQELYERARAGIADKSVYFAFNDAVVSAAQIATVEAHARLANTYARDQITVQGNCDERGGREYNLALGQRRAQAVKARLVLLGVPESRIEAISYGKEKPRALCHAEDCWKENRRVDFQEVWK